MKTTDQGTFKQASQDFFAEKQLSDNALKRAEQLLSQAPENAQDTPVTEGEGIYDNNTSSQRFNPAIVAASIIATAILSSAWLIPSLHLTEPTLLSSSPSSSSTLSQKQMIAAIANEVTKNHIKLKPLEVISHDFNRVRDYFTQLDFAPQLSSHFPQLSSSALTMTGGRYCSIQSETAAQLRYQTAADIKSGTTAEPSWSTLYQTQYKPDTFGPLPQIERGESAIETYSRGLKVNIWVERQLLMVSVEDTH